MFINKEINLNRLKKNSPDYFIFMNNLIDDSYTLYNTRIILKNRYPTLSRKISKKELERLGRIYELLHRLKKIYKFKK